ncbi:MAG: tetratricopeptide repeat protein [Burkholderiaceae bacterium]
MALRTLRVFISSPGDVAEERVIARRVIGRLDSQFGELLHLEAVFWEHAPLVATASFQEQLAKPSETDVTIVILWSRLGTALPPHIRREEGSVYASGTEFEFEDAVTGFQRCGKPRLLVYRKTAATTETSDLKSLEDAVRQKQAMERFVAKWFRNDADGSLKAAFHNFASPAEFEDLLEAHMTRLAEQHLPAGAVVHGGAPTWRGSSPFRGLEVFEPQHSPVFFGRTAAVASVLAKLRMQAQARKAFVLIVSMSGGGKSSLVRAGVLPLMVQPGVVGMATIWRHAVMRPSDGRGRPTRALVRALLLATMIDATEDNDLDIDESATALERPLDLAQRLCDRLDAIARDRSPDDAAECHLALVVDQLEEMFSDERIAEQDRDSFFAAIDALARGGKVWVIATMRSDAYPRISEQLLLVALKEGEGQFDLLPPSLREIGQIIRFPAAAAGLRFEVRTSTAERLDDVIRDAAAKNPGALPLLQFLLEELYKRRNNEDVLTFRAYEQLGGVEGALAQRAEAVLASVSGRAQKSLTSVLRELVTFGGDDESKPLRRVAPRDAFQSKDARELVDALIEARLLVSTLDADGQSAISLAHEALLEFWPRLRSWRDEDRELLLVHARLTSATRAWEKNARSADLLLARGKPLSEAKELVSAGVHLTAPESALLIASERRARRFAQLRAGAIIGLGGLAVVAAGAAYKANVESGRAQVQATTAQRTTDFMVSLFANADPDQSQGEKVTVREVLDRGVVQIGNALQGEDSVRANLLRAMGQSYDGLGMFAKAKEVLLEAVAKAGRGGIPVDLMRARMALAENRYQDGDYDESEALYRAALVQARQIEGNESMAVAQALTGIGENLAEKNAREEAESNLRKALALDIKLRGERDKDTARTLDALGRLMYFAGQYDEVEALYRRLIEVQKAVYGARHTFVARTLNNLATVNSQLGRYDEAERAYAEALDIKRSVVGDKHRSTAVALNNLGRVELMRGRLDAARAHLNEAVAIDRSALAPGHDGFIVPLNNLAMVLMAQGHAEDAKELLDEAAEIAKSRKHWMLNQVLGNQAEQLLMTGHVAESRAALDQAKALAASQYGTKLTTTDSWRVAVLDTTEASYYLAIGRPADAQRLLVGALPKLEKQFGPHSFFVDRATERLAASTAHVGASGSK